MKKSNADLRPMLCSFLLAAAGLPLHAHADQQPRAGDQTVAQVCSACHGSGLMDAPRIGDGNAWGARLKRAGSLDALASSAEHGRGDMPPRGGVPELTHDDLKAAIHYMLNKSGVDL